MVSAYLKYNIVRKKYGTQFQLCYLVHSAPPLGTLGDGYILTGDVESVLYSSDSDRWSSTWPCYVAISDADASAAGNLYYHAARRDAICQFAEKCRERGLPVKMQAKTYSESYIVEKIEYADTKARY